MARFDPVYGSLRSAAAAVRRGQVSSAELTQAVLDRIAKLNPKINAICWSFAEQAIEAAKAADQARGSAAGKPFHGVPITVKESFGVAGSPCTWGLAEHKDYRSKTTAMAVRRLTDAGAIVVGKTNVPPNLQDWQSYNSIYGVTNNPWDLTRTPGGSSGGSAAALAAGLGFASIGSDIGGSLRVPAHFCGIYAHKPSINVVPLQGHLPGPFSDVPTNAPLELPVAGPMARSPRDLLEMLRVLGGPMGPDTKAYRWLMPAPRHRTLADFRVGYLIDDPRCPVTSEAGAVFENAIDQLSRAGVKLEKGWPERVDPIAHQRPYMNLMLSTGMALPELKYNDWANDNRVRFMMRAVWESYFESHDVFVCPVAFTPAFPHDHSADTRTRKIGDRPYMDMMFWQHQPVLAGLPSTAVPAGRTKSGLPVGLQIIGPYLEDATPLEFAALIEPVIGGFVKPPDFA
jgi:amidase